MTTRRLALCAAALLAAACTRVVGGAPTTETGLTPSEFDVGRVMLDQPRMQAITGGGEHLTVIPSMDTASPVDIDTLAQTAPPPCRFVFAETVTFGPDVEAFHKTTFQDPPHGGIISEGAAAYHDGDTARRAFGALVSTVRTCADSSVGYGLIGAWNADDRSLQTRPGGCGRDYQIKSVVLMEVTYCGFPDSVSTIVMSNLAANVPG
ncbi:sensor domain-containing protein [Mycobacterium paraterrae]|uniref:Sensor domain-containing protein n=1 Tax=Mycobacterium paraterrae TaxID=577492 RepID=A0ABY3VKS5_9MYCO|nr:sensor domain-containing protein [Mycobacterium paraterrae]UMB68088.1 sensor domain-containing protein [Mycobacterium paraterrae]